MFSVSAEKGANNEYLSILNGDKLKQVYSHLWCDAMQNNGKLAHIFFLQVIILKANINDLAHAICDPQKINCFRWSFWHTLNTRMTNCLWEILLNNQTPTNRRIPRLPKLVPYVSGMFAYLCVDYEVKTKTRIFTCPIIDNLHQLEIN